MYILGFTYLLRLSFLAVLLYRSGFFPQGTLVHPYPPLPTFGPVFPGAHQYQIGAVGGLRYLKKNSCLHQARIQLVVAVNSEYSGSCLGHLPLSNGPAYLARDWASPYLLTLACLPLKLRPPLGEFLGSGTLRVSSMAQNRAWTSSLTP